MVVSCPSVEFLAIQTNVRRVRQITLSQVAHVWRGSCRILLDFILYFWNGCEGNSVLGSGHVIFLGEIQGLRGADYGVDFSSWHLKVR
jgi:hypothetical protein